MKQLDKQILKIVILGAGIACIISSLILANCGLYIYQIYSYRTFDIIGKILLGMILETVIASVYYVLKLLYMQASMKPSGQSHNRNKVQD